MTTLEEMGQVMRAAPGPAADLREVADWYHRKALLLDHLATGSQDAEATRMHVLADLAREHAEQLLSAPENNYASTTPKL
ncbi:MAG: hypothetical protein WBA97_16330 [Actinophytocola sp.]|uniref:hypothetical protein n=1 Tax=Actinophytocola sp. TaxID=1872138 RepID=UPI003C783091